VIENNGETMFSKLGTSVAMEMEQILNSENHIKLFKKADKTEAVKTEGVPINSCKCPKNCECVQKDGKCECKCVQKNGKCECKCAQTSEALQDLSYTFSKISKTLDDAGYVKSAVAVLRAYKSFISEAGNDDDEWMDELDYEPETFPYVKDSPKDFELDEFIDNEPETSRYVKERRPDVDVSPEDLEFLEALEEEESPDTLRELEGPETISERDYDFVNDAVLTQANSDIDAWLKKNASDVNLKTSLADLTAKENIDTQLINGYLAELESFEDED
jgi:hypothetical protein